MITEKTCTQSDGIEKPCFTSRSLSLTDTTGNTEGQENDVRDAAGMVYTGTSPS